MGDAGTRWLPAVSAALFGLAAAVFGLVFFREPGLGDAWRLFAGLGVALAVLWGVAVGRRLSGLEPSGGWVRYGVTGALVPMAVGTTGGLIVGVWFLVSEQVMWDDLIVVPIAYAGYGLLFGVVAVPLGIAVGLVLRAVTNWLNRTQATPPHRGGGPA